MAGQERRCKIAHPSRRIPRHQLGRLSRPDPWRSGRHLAQAGRPFGPFRKPDTKEPVTSYDVADIAKLNYSYEYTGILNPVDPMPGKGFAHVPPSLSEQSSPVMSISNISRARIGGSFVVTAWATPKDGSREAVLLGAEAVLSRQHVTGCANCQKHLQVNLRVPLRGFSREQAEEHKYNVIVHTRDRRAPTRPGDKDHAGYGAQPSHQEPEFKLHFGHLKDKSGGK